MKQNLTLKISQNLALTPQLQQSIRLLQLSTQELNQELESILQANPLLELADTHEDGSIVEVADDEINTYILASNSVEAQQPEQIQEVSLSNEQIPSDFSESYTEDADFGSNTRWDESGNNNENDDDFYQQEACAPSLREHLLSQINLMPLSERDMTLATLLIDSINEDGYLDQSLETLVALMPAELEIDLLELQTAQKLIQHLDPPGIGALNLSECLLLQLEVMPSQTPYLSDAIKIVTSHLNLLATRDFVKLRKILNCNETDLRGTQQLIQQLNPRPGSSYSIIQAEHFIQHEVIVKKYKGTWTAHLNDEVIPKLRINQMYADILKRNRESSGAYLSSQLQEARWMIKNIQQRFSTILRVSQAIVDRQRNFFEHGEIAMRPLVLREIADELELHESTISRVTTHKYMMTPRGVYELKYFFGSHVSTDSGGECSATAIRALIKQLIANENLKKPLSDSQISDILAKQGIVVARRTIAKYREAMMIPPTSLRKSL